MKKTYIFLISIIILLFSLFALLLQDSQSKFTLKVKSSIPKELRFFLKKSINQYFYNFDINLKYIKKNNIVSSNGVTFNILEYNNKLLDYQGPRAYLGFKDRNIFLVTGTGLISYSKIDGLLTNKNIKFKILKSNLKEIIKYEDFYLNSNYGIKGILVTNQHIYLSFSNEVSKDCINISVIKSHINLEKLKFSYLFKSSQCVKKTNSYGEFQPIQSGGVMSDYNNNKLLLTTGEFRFRDHAQDDESIFGKLLLVDKISGEYKIVSKGHRNAQGLFYDKVNNVILSTEHGPFGGDEVNIIKDILKKNNFGWPISSYGEHYPTMAPKDAYEKAPLHKSHSNYGFIEPIKYFVPSIGISQILKAEEGFQKSNNYNYFFASMGYADRVNALSIHQIVFDKDYQNILYEDKLRIGNRIRDIVYLPKEKIIVGYLEKKGSLIILSQNDQ